MSTIDYDEIELDAKWLSDAVAKDGERLACERAIAARLRALAQHAQELEQVYEGTCKVLQGSQRERDALRAQVVELETRLVRGEWQATERVAEVEHERDDLRAREKNAVDRCIELYSDRAALRAQLDAMRTREPTEEELFGQSWPKRQPDAFDTRRGVWCYVRDRLLATPEATGPRRAKCPEPVFEYPLAQESEEEGRVGGESVQPTGSVDWGLLNEPRMAGPAPAASMSDAPLDTPIIAKNWDTSTRTRQVYEQGHREGALAAQKRVRAVWMYLKDRCEADAIIPLLLDAAGPDGDRHIAPAWLEPGE